jgi:hypothetical protein
MFVSPEWSAINNGGSSVWLQRVQIVLDSVVGGCRGTDAAHVLVLEEVPGLAELVAERSQNTALFGDGNGGQFGGVQQSLAAVLDVCSNSKNYEGNLC